MEKEKKWNICMVSDFFYPQFGGVESHIYNLANCFIQRGHKVIILTKATNNRNGIRYMSKNLLKVYYIPLFMVKSSYGIDTVPTLFCNISLYRNIFLREKIDIVHGHQSSSTMAHESCYAAMLMGIKTVITDHSLFGFDGLLEIHFNKGLQFSNMLIDHFISVSNTGKQNYILRTELKSKYWNKISVIPNAIDSSSFEPLKIEKLKTERIIIVIVARLVYRKGVTLLKEVIPQICQKHSNVDFLIGGDGALKYLLEQTIENFFLYDRVKLLGAIPSDDVRNILVKGDIFLNCSLTEAFGISILEAASCGLLIVSTKVGGVPEILPNEMMNLVEPKVILIDTPATRSPRPQSPSKGNLTFGLTENVSETFQV